MRIIVILLLLFLSGCKRVTINREYEELKERALIQTNHMINWQDINQKMIKTPPKQKEIPEVKSPVSIESFSRQQAIGYALQNNYELQAAFEDLGIAKADLVQAGLYTNPQVDLFVKFPVFGLPADEEAFVNKHTKMDLETLVQLADLWKVPVKKKIAHDDFELMTLALIHMTIKISVDTKFAYDTCLYMEERINLLEDVFEKLCALRERIYYRQGFGFEQDLDRYLIDMRLAKWETMIIHQKADLKAAYAILRNLMGLSVSAESIYLCDQLDYGQKSIPSVSALEEIGLKYHAELQMTHLKIQKFEHKLSLERRKIFNDVKFGAAYERDLIQGQGFGPAISLKLPMFDPNYAQIAKARFMLKRAKKVYKAHKRDMLENIYYGNEKLNGFKKGIEIYKQSILPASQNAINFSTKYFNTMQQNVLILLESQITWFEAQEEILTKNYKMAHAYADLEKAVGKLIS